MLLHDISSILLNELMLLGQRGAFEERRPKFLDTLSSLQTN
jgi:hypothetical protein